MKEDHLIGEVLLDGGEVKHLPRWKSSSWRISVSFGLVTIVIVLACNIGLHIWTTSNFKTEDGLATVYEGDCKVSDKIALWSHLVINILGTMLFSASNNCAQLLCSPTRVDVEAAHRKGRWLDIGIPSWRNLKQVPFWRSWLWAALMLSSIPLHLIYNSVIYTTTFKQSYQQSLVTEDFVSGGSWNRSRAAAVNPRLDQDLLSSLQHNASAGMLQRVDREQCTQLYGRNSSDPKNYHTSEYGSVVVVTSFNSSDAFVDTYDAYGGRNTSCMNDLCPPTGTNATCRASLLDAEGAFQARCIAQCPSAGSVNTTCWADFARAIRLYSNNDTHVQAAARNLSSCYDKACVARDTTTIEYCLAESVAPRCMARININMLVTVIVFNLIKIMALLATLCVPFQPLATIGDAIASFLNNPATELEGLGPVSIFDLLKAGKSSSSHTRLALKGFEKKTSTWGDAVNIENGNRWQWGSASSMLYWTASFLMLCISVMKFKDTSAFTMTVKLEDLESNIVGFTRGASVSLATSLPNIPQLILSFVYVFYNNTLTSMLQDYEYSKFATHRKPLRVSSPTGQQRSTYWLQIPYRYILPLMSVMALLHFLIARTIYFVQQNAYDAHGLHVPEDSISACSYSVLPHILALVLGAILIGGLWAISFRKLEPGVPLASSCSLVIAIACANAGEENAALRPLRYGILSERGADEEGRRYVGFSSGEVEPLEDGVVYR